MKRTLISLTLIVALASMAAAQNKKAEKDSLAQVKFEKSLNALNEKDFVIIVESFDRGGGVYEPNSDNSVFFSYEKEYAFLQGQIIAGNAHTNRLTVSDFVQTTDKKGNVKSVMQVRGSMIIAKIEITLRKGGNTGDVIITPTKGEVKRFNGAIVPRSESKYFKRPGII